VIYECDILGLNDSIRKIESLQEPIKGVTVYPKINIFIIIYLSLGYSNFQTFISFFFKRQKKIF